MNGMPVCTLCGAMLPPDALQRCPACGLYQELGPTRANPFQGGPALATLIGGLLVIYAITFGIVALQ